MSQAYALPFRRDEFEKFMTPAQMPAAQSACHASAVLFPPVVLYADGKFVRTDSGNEKAVLQAYYNAIIDEGNAGIGEYMSQYLNGLEDE